MMFKNLQETEEVFVGTINECKRHFEFSKKTKKLFESINFDPDFRSKNKIDFYGFHGNKIAYFNSVNTLLENESFKQTMLFESEDFNDFRFDLLNEINRLALIDEISILLRLDPLILNTKLKSHNPLIVKGFDILNFNKILESNGLDKCFMVAYCKSNKTLIFLAELNYYIYDINTANISKHKIDKKVSLLQGLDFINTVYSRNVLILASNTPKKSELDSLIKDNLFSDKKLGDKYKQIFKKINEKGILQ